MITDNGQILTDKLVTVGNAPGYRDITLTVDLNNGAKLQTGIEQVQIVLSKEDVSFLVAEIARIQKIAFPGGVDGPWALDYEGKTDRGLLGPVLYTRG